MVTTPGQLLINDILPPDMRRYDHVLDKGGISRLLKEVAEKHPDKYKDIAQKLMELGHYNAEASGTSLTLSHLIPTPEIQKELDTMRQVVNTIAYSNMPDKDKEKKIIEYVNSKSQPLQKAIYQSGLLNDNPYADQVKSGSRGNDTQLKQLVAGDMLVQDQNDKVQPVPILRGYAHGIEPAEYWAASYGARKGAVSTKMSTASGGAFSKQLVLANHRQVVTSKDCGTQNGIPSTAKDSDNVGTILAKEAGGYKAGTVLTPNILKDLGDSKIIVRSPITCQAPDGLCSKCAGIREKGRLPEIGDNLGVAAAQAVGEKITQGALCLAEDTLVKMADFSTKKIQDIEVGDYVLGSDIKGNVAPTRVVNTFNNGLKECYLSLFSDSQIHRGLISTLDHKILSNTGIRPVGEPLDSFTAKGIAAILLDNYKPKLKELQELSLGDNCKLIVQIYLRLINTYDIEVDHPDHLFVLANGLIVSNSEKHKGGAVTSLEKNYGGFNNVEQLINIPSTFRESATISKYDGSVQKIEKAPQGGEYIYINNEPHYVGPDHKVEVKTGDKVEAGDVLSDGIVNPEEITHHRGIGEGRMSWVKSMSRGLKDSGLSSHRRNLEVIARGLINHVKVTDLDNHLDALPEETIPYNYINKTYKPRDGAEALAPHRALNKYLEEPSLHYSIGTRITPKVADSLKDYGINEVLTHKDPPPFESEMIAAKLQPIQDPNWMARLGGGYMERSILSATHKGLTSKTHDTSFIPSLAKGTEFGDNLNEEGLY